jgi:predicted dehydrogenase
MAVYDDDTLPTERVKVYDHGVEALSIEELWRSYRAGDIHSPRIPDAEPLQLEMRHFIACVNGEAISLSDGEAGLRVVKVLEAGMHSLRAGSARVPYAAELPQSRIAPKLYEAMPEHA